MTLAVTPGTVCGVIMGPRRSVLFVLGALSALALWCAAPALALEPAGDGWYWQLPQPQGQILNAVAMPDATNAWAVGYGGAIVHSADGGASWSVQASTTTEPLAAVAFADAQHGCAVGGLFFESYIFGALDSVSSVILRTDDGGASWKIVAQPSKYPLTAVAFADAQTGWAVGKHGTILRTVDGGATWTAQVSGVTRPLWAVTFADARHGWAAGAEGLLLTTTDGGLTWSRIHGNGRFFWDECGSLAIDGAGTLWAAMGTLSMSGDFDRLLRSSDGGRHWRRVDLGWDYNMWSVVADGLRIAGVGPVDAEGMGDTSRVVLSTDGGQTWSTRVLGEGVELRGVALGGPQALCAVGGGTFWSADAGETWAGAGLPAGSVGSLDFVSPTEGWATGGGSYAALIGYFMSGGSAASVLHTADGASWQEQLSEPDRSFLDVDFVDAEHGWVVGTRGSIRYTADGGSTWTAQASGVSGYLLQVDAVDTADVWTVGIAWTREKTTPLLLRTTDGGDQWQQVSAPADCFPLVMSCLDTRDVWLAGVGEDGMELWHTVDAGATWTPAAMPGAQLKAVPLSLDFTDALHGWVVAEPVEGGQSVVLRTTDGGQTWTSVGEGVFTGNHFLSSVDFVDAEHGWVGGDRIFATSDGGATWTLQVDGLQMLAGLAAADQTHAWAGGDGGGILSTVDASGDTAAPTTLSEGARGWTRRATQIALTADDVGGSGVASTEYSLDGGAWQLYLAPFVFPAPSDHSGDGAHRLAYRSTDAGGLVGPVQSCVVRVDTVRPECKLRSGVIGRDGVLRIKGRIDDASTSYVDDFGIVVSRRGRTVVGSFWEGFRWPTGRWRLLRDSHMGFPGLTRGWYRVRLLAWDPAGNRQRVVGESRLLVKWRGGSSYPVPGAAPAIRRLVAPTRDASAPAWLPSDVRTVLERLAEHAR